MDFDITIVGAGPAGATCLWALADKGLRILVVEKADFPREKACGDAVPGLALKVWGAMGSNLVAKLHTLASALPLAEGFVCGPGGSKTRVQFTKPGLVVKRAELDETLFEHARAATPCTLWKESLKNIEVLRDGFRLTMTSGRVTTTRRIAAADGAQGPCRKLLVGQGWLPSEVSVAVRAYMPKPSDGGAGAGALALWFDKAVMPGYLWAFPLRDGTLNVGAGILGNSQAERPVGIKQVLATWTQQKAQDERPKGEIDTMTWLGQKLPLGKVGRPICGPGYVLLGDAGGLIAPATGDGIGQAALSGKLGAEALALSLDIHELKETSSILKAYYENPVYSKLGGSYTAQRRMVWLGRKLPLAFELLIRLAGQSGWLRKKLASL